MFKTEIASLIEEELKNQETVKETLDSEIFKDESLFENTVSVTELQLHAICDRIEELTEAEERLNNVFESDLQNTNLVVKAYRDDAIRQAEYVLAKEPSEAGGEEEGKDKDSGGGVPAGEGEEGGEKKKVKDTLLRRIRKKVEELISQAIAFFKEIFSLNKRRIKAAEKLQDVIGKLRVDEVSTLKISGPANVFTYDDDGPKFLPVEGIQNAIDEVLDLKINDFADQVRDAGTDKNLEETRTEIKRIIKGYAPDQPHNPKAFAAFNPTDGGKAPLRVSFIDKNDLIVVKTEFDQSFVARLVRKGSLTDSVNKFTKDQISDLVKGAIACYHFVDEVKASIPDNSERKEFIKGATDQKAATMSITASMRILIAFTRYSGYIANGSMSLAKSFVEAAQ